MRGRNWRILVAIAVAAGAIVLAPDSIRAERPGALQGEEGPRGVDAYARANYVWPYAAGPYYGEVAVDAEGSADVLRTAVGSFRLGRGDLGLPSELTATNKLGKVGAQYFVVQLDPAQMGDSLPALEDGIASAGGALVGALGGGSLVARLTVGSYDVAQSMPGVIAVEPYHPAFKLDPTIGRVALPDPIRAVSDIYSLEIRVFRGEDSAAVAQALSGLGAEVTLVTTDTVYAKLHRTKLVDAAALDAVEMIWESLPQMLHGEETTTTMQTGAYNSGAIPYHDAGVDGSGGGVAPGGPQRLMVLDSGIQLDAGDLSDTRTTAGVAGTNAANAAVDDVHRKVLVYASTAGFGGTGDLLGCDAGPSGGYTHGHTVSAGALGNATNALAGTYGLPYRAENPNVAGQFWDLDGVARGRS
jgi:hypothetical protein